MKKNVYAIKGSASYFDRRIRRLETLWDYLGGKSCWFSSTDGFNFADGISTSHTFNIEPKADLDGVPNYVLVCNDKNEIESRWFVMECVYIRERQYTLNLRRDVVADYMPDLLRAPCYVERGPLTQGSPFLFAQEDMVLNQIKTGEALLKDESGSAWIVGYVSRDTTDDSEIVASTPAANTSAYPTLSTLGISWNDDADPSQGGTFEGCQEIDYVIRQRSQQDGNTSAYRLFHIHSNGTAEEVSSLWNANACIYHNLDDYEDSVYPRTNADAVAWKARVSAAKASLDSDFGEKHDVGTPSEYMDIMAANGRIFYDSVHSKFFRLTVTSLPYYSGRDIFDQCDPDDLPALRTRIISLVAAQASSYTNVNGEYYADGWVAASTHVYKLIISAEEVFISGQLKTTMSATRKALSDAPYDMFCMRLNENNLALAYQICIEPPAAGKVKKIYDLQILPYCPRRDALTDTGISVSGLTSGTDYQEIYKVTDGGDVLIDYLFWCVQSSFSFFLDVPSPEGDSLRTVKSRTGDPAMDKKLSGICDLFRLSSPNYSAAFDFSIVKNGGGVSQFRVDFTYRPVMPYIHVCPVFSGLYGSFNNDARGLICGGDYSVDMISDPWTEYMSNNKNYENIFNTSIKRMDAIREYDRAAQALSGTLTTIAATAAGAAHGGMAGGLFGFAGGATRAIGQAVSAEGKYQAERKAALDTFRYELGNIQAAPNSLTKVSAYNVNNKYFPVVEFYTCTEEEEKAVVDFLSVYNFRIGAMTTLAKVLEARTKTWEFVKGRISRFEIDSRSEDSHFLDEVYAEIDRGVFIYG